MIPLNNILDVLIVAGALWLAVLASVGRRRILRPPHQSQEGNMEADRKPVFSRHIKPIRVRPKRAAD